MNEKTITNKLKELSKHGIVYGVGTALESLLNFLLIPIFLNKFPTNVFGSFALIQLTASMASAFFYFGGSSALSRFYFDAKNDYDKKIWFSNSLYITLLGAIIMCVISLISGKYLSTELFGGISYLNTFFLFILSFSISILNTNFYILLRLLKKSSWFIVLKLFSLLSTIGFIFIFINKLPNIAEATALGYMTGNLLIFIILILKFNSSISLQINIEVMKKYLLFGIPISISSFMFLIIDWTVRYFVKTKLGFNELGLFSMGLKLGTLVQAGYIIPFSLIWSTIRMEYRNDHNTNLFFNKVATYFIVAGISIVFFLSIYINPIINLISNNNNYSQSLYIIPIMLLSQLAWGTVNILDYGIYINNKTYLYVFYDIISIILVILLSIFFINNLGIFGAAVINFIGYATAATLIYYKSNTYFPIKIKRSTTLFFLFIAFFFYAISFYIESYIQDNISLSIIKSTIILCLYSISVYFCIDKEDRNKIKLMIKYRVQTIIP